MYTRGDDMRGNVIEVRGVSKDFEGTLETLEDIGLELVVELTCLICGETCIQGDPHECPELARVAICGDTCSD
jgi:rubrerythrin